MSRQVIDDITLLKSLGKGSFGEVFLSTRKGKSQYFATKKMDRKNTDKPSIRKYFENEIKLLNSLNHPNIVKLEALRATKDHYYIVMEYVNGGCLTDCLNKYKAKFRNPFPEQIVQYLMRQIVDAINYIHNLKIIHRDLKLDNIMVHFDNENDKNALNMMRATIKIIDFGFAIQMSKSELAYSALGSPINMDPLILQKFTKKGGNINNLGYDSKADIWSLGTICYEMIIGEAVFNAETMKDLVTKVENGSYKVPTSLSKEIVSFLNGMLQYDGKSRLSASELIKHPFLTKNVKDFTRIDTRQVSRKVRNNELNINIKKNQTIWAIFNEEDEKKLLNINNGREGPIPEDSSGKKRALTDKTIPRMNNINKNIEVNPMYNNNNNIPKVNSNPYPSFDGFSGDSFYGQNMYPNMNNYKKIKVEYQNNQNVRDNFFGPMFNFPTFSPMVREYSFGGGIYDNMNDNSNGNNRRHYQAVFINNSPNINVNTNQNRYQNANNNMKIYTFSNNNNHELDNLCCIQ